MLEINLSKINKSYNSNKVLDDFSLALKTGEHIGLIGPNGCGKTTTFNIIMGEYFDSGNISIRKGARVGVLSQIPKLESNNETGLDVLLRGLKEILDKESNLNELIKKIEEEKDENKKNKLISKLTIMQEDFSLNDGYKIDENISKIKKYFKISDDMLKREFNVLSGGEKTLITLASLVLGNYDILLLDEPTNHLDIETLEWLEGYLKVYKGSLLISSHDRYFLDKVVNKIVYINEGHEEVYDGNYTYYLNESERRELKLFEQYKVQKRQIEAMEASIKRLKDWGVRSDNPAFFRRAASIQKRLDKIERIELSKEKKDIPLNFNDMKRSGNTVLTIDNLSLSIKDHFLFKADHAFIGYNDRVALLGKNGVGKSTFIKEILSGVNESIKLGKSIVLGYIPQEIRFDNDLLSIYEFARRIFDGPESKLRASLSRYYFTEETLSKKINVLSGGEKVRLKLFELITKNANFLILDEPTNHIDIDTREVLESALLSYNGTILFVSHDRYFISKLATKIFLIEDNKLKVFNESYEDYKERIFKEEEKRIRVLEESKIKLNVPKEIKEYVSNATIYDINGYNKIKLYKLVKKNTTYYLKISSASLKEEKDKLEFLIKQIPVPKVIAYLEDEGKYYLVTKEVEGVPLSTIEDKELLFNILVESYAHIYLCDTNGFPSNDKGYLNHGDLTLDNIIVKNKKLSGFVSLRKSYISNELDDLKTIDNEIKHYLGKSYVDRFHKELGL